MVEKPIALLPLVWTSAPNALPQTLQNLTVKPAIDGLTRGYEFLVDSASDVGKKKRSTWTWHCCELDAPFFFRSRWIWRLPVRRPLLGLRVITIHPCFVSGYDIGDESGVVSGLLFEFPADRNAMDLLVVAQRLGKQISHWSSSWSVSFHVCSCDLEHTFLNSNHYFLQKSTQYFRRHFCSFVTPEFLHLEVHGV